MHGDLVVENGEIIVEGRVGGQFGRHRWHLYGIYGQYSRESNRRESECLTGCGIRLQDCLELYRIEESYISFAFH